MTSPDTCLWMGVEGLVIFVHILMNWKYSSNDDVSWGCSCWHCDTPLSGMSSFQNNEEKCDMHIDTKSSPGHTNVSSVPLSLLSQLSSPSLASLRFFTCSRLILSFLNIFNRLRENSLLLPPS